MLHLLVLWGWVALAYLAEIFFFNSARKFRRLKTPNLPPYTPSVSLIVPFKGEDFEMEKNIRSFLSQDYKNLEILFVAHSKGDSSYKILKQFSKKASILVRDSRYGNCSFKIASQLTAIKKARGEVLAFADSDVRPKKNWLSELVRPLQNAAATTSCPWYIPPKNNFSSCLQSSWNSSAGLSLTVNQKHNFIRGCSFAIKSPTFKSLGMEKIWEGEFSDDASLTLKLKKEQLPITFVPEAIVPIFEDFDLPKLKELTTRWVKIVKHYSNKTIRFAFLIYGFLALVFMTGLILLFEGIFQNSSYILPAILLLLPQLFSVLRARMRFKKMEALFPEEREGMRKTRSRVVALDFFVKFLILFNIAKAKRMKSVRWRGKEYQLS